MNEYWEVIEKSTGRVICHCGEEKDAFMMISMKPTERAYRRSTFLQDNVINVNFTKAKELPGQQGLPAATFKLNQKQVIKLPVNQERPLNLKE